MKLVKTLTEPQIERYSRQILLSQIGGAGQKKLLNARVTVVGAGGLGCPAAQALAAAGVGAIRIIDADRVELSNLPRQFLHHTKDVGRYKVDSIREKIQAMNPDVTVEAVRAFADKDNIAELLRGSDYVIEACDGQAAKFLVNDACVHLGIPFTIAGVVQFYGQIISVIPGKTRCLRCLFREPAPEDPQNSCSGAGVMGPAPGMAGMIQASEAIKSITGAGSLQTDKLMIFNLFDCSFDFLDIAAISKCAVAKILKIRFTEALITALPCLSAIWGLMRHREGKGLMTTDSRQSADAVCDLRGKKCPMTFVYTKLELEKLEPGQTLEIILNYAPSFANVPRSVKLQDLGEVVRQSEETGGEKSLWIRKK